MPKILKETIKKIPSKTSLRIYKKSNSTNYYCSFYVGRLKIKSGNKEKTLRTANVKVATKKAIETYNKIMPEIESSKKLINFDKDIAYPFFAMRIRKYRNKGKEDKQNQGVRDKSFYDNYMSTYFSGFDYRNHELLSAAISDLTNNLKLDKKTDNTISKKICVLNQMFKRAQNLGTLKSVPDMPSLSVINKPRLSYSNEELNLINRRLEELHDKNVSPNVSAHGDNIKSIEYLELKDYLNLIRSGGFRPGIQPLMIKNWQYQYLTDKTNPQDPILQFTLFNTKTSPQHKLTCHPYFTKNIFPEIVKRHPNNSSEDYLLFPNRKNRISLYARISKIFIRVSSSLGLYHKNGSTRPLYSIRHTFISNRYNDNAPLEVVARSANTSVKIVKKSYLDSEDTMMINEHKRLFPKVAMFSASAKKAKK